ncbi:MAG: ATP:cob(I)alamin adenosyltransferase, partial [Patescibacteria group bacterium]
MALFTGKGDTGTTKLFDTGRASKDGARHDSAESGKRVMKSAPIFECLGQLDELNTIVGWTKTATPGDFAFDGRSGKELLEDVQDHLFTIQAEVAGAQKSIPQSSVETLSSIINSIEKELPEIKTFLVPGG